MKDNILHILGLALGSIGVIALAYFLSSLLNENTKTIFELFNLSVETILSGLLVIFGGVLYAIGEIQEKK